MALRKGEALLPVDDIWLPDKKYQQNKSKHIDVVNGNRNRSL